MEAVTLHIQKRYSFPLVGDGNPLNVFGINFTERLANSRFEGTPPFGWILFNELEPSLLTGFLSASAVVNAHPRLLPD